MVYRVRSDLAARLQASETTRRTSWSCSPVPSSLWTWTLTCPLTARTGMERGPGQFILDVDYEKANIWKQKSHLRFLIKFHEIITSNVYFIVNMINNFKCKCEEKGAVKTDLEHGEGLHHTDVDPKLHPHLIKEAGNIVLFLHHGPQAILNIPTEGCCFLFQLVSSIASIRTLEERKFNILCANNSLPLQSRLMSRSPSPGSSGMTWRQA